jgi:hypothetical protein
MLAMLEQQQESAQKTQNVSGMHSQLQNQLHHRHSWRTLRAGDGIGVSNPDVSDVRCCQHQVI